MTPDTCGYCCQRWGEDKSGVCLGCGAPPPSPCSLDTWVMLLGQGYVTVEELKARLDAWGHNG